MSDKQKQERIWSLFFIVICILVLIENAVTYMMDNTLSIYAVDMWPGKASLIAGYLTTSFTAGALIAEIFTGNMTDRLGRQKILVLGLGCFGLGVGLMMVSTAVWFNLACRFLAGLGKGIFGVSSMSIAADLLPKAKMGQGMTFFGLGTSLATAFGPTIGLVLIASGNYKLLFITDTLLFVVSLIMAICFLNYEKKEPYKSRIFEEKQEADRIRQDRDSYKGIWKFFEKGAIPGSTLVFFYSAGMTGFLIYLTVYATSVLHYSSGRAGSFFTVACICMIIAQLFVGKIIDRFGVRGVACAGMACGVMDIVFLITVGGIYPMYLISGALYGLTTELLYPAMQTAVIQDSPKNRRGAASSTLSFMLDFAILILSVLLGAVTQLFGYQTMFLISAVFPVVGIILSLVLMNNRARQKRRRQLGIE